MSVNNILLTGDPGIGKTTLLRRIAARLGSPGPVGFFTEEIRDHGVRKGFELVASDGRRRLLSHVDFDSRHRVGKYGVDVAGFDEFLASLDLGAHSRAVVIIDEIGKMECMSARFKRLIQALLDADRPLLASIARSGGGFISDVKSRQDCELVELTQSNRNRIENDLIGLLRS